MPRPRPRLAAALVCAALAGCGPSASPPPPRGALTEVVRGARQWTGIAVTATGRVFLAFPRWSDDYEPSLVELLSSGTLRPYPDQSWNDWRSPNGVPPSDASFVCLQALHVDGKGRLWALDPASPRFGGVVPNGAKLVRFDPTYDRVTGVFPFDQLSAPPDSYLNDVRVDAARETAYVTDSGLGGIVVLDLATKEARRFLTGHPSTRAEPDLVPSFQGREWRYRRDGKVPQVHSDGIALDAKGEWLYWQALTGRTLWRVPTAALRAPDASDATVAAAVERVGETVMCDGMEMDEQGNLYLTALERDAVVVRRPDGRIETLVSDPRLAWPDSLSFGPGPSLYVTTSQIHRSEGFLGNDRPPQTPYRVFRVGL